MKKDNTTPLIKQYLDIKAKYPGIILFYQVGDFYELFFEDAKIVSSFLAITLTKRGKKNGQDIPLCGIPVHAVSHYLVKMIKGGFKVAICDQITKPEQGKIVERKVTRVFTPGTLTDSLMLDDKSASYLFSFFPSDEICGLIFTELLTAKMFATVLPVDSNKLIETELSRFFPDEIILPNLQSAKKFDYYFKRLGYLVSFSDFIKDSDSSRLWVERQFNPISLGKLKKFPILFSSLQILYFYLRKNQAGSLQQFKDINFYEPEDYLILDSSTQKNLEIIKNNQDGSRRNSLFSILDKAKTPMGSRTIKKWLLRPLIQEKIIFYRQEFVESILSNISLMQRMEKILASISDIERIIGRIALGRALLRDYLELKQTLLILPGLKKLVSEQMDCHLSKLILDKLKNFNSLAELLDASLNDFDSSNGIIKKGFDFRLDELRAMAKDGQKKILELEKEEIEATGISSLKIRFNNVTGYYIEVTKSNFHMVPDYYIAQQTLVNRKRFVTPRLRALEIDMVRAKNDFEREEKEVFEKIKGEVENRLSDLRQLSDSLCMLDALYSFSVVAYNNSYIRPVFGNDCSIEIKNGRHPIVEQKNLSSFIPNDTTLSKKESLWIVTGPNMGGKSTYLRQVALICVMAQCGSFVPADSANLPILDRIFTRIGSGDNLAEGKSTFFVEMEETAEICNLATRRSFVILDEVGRGTSTFDGMALAQAIVEYIFSKIGCLCLFATHYHEITKLSKIFNGIKNYHMLSKKINDSIVFLYKIEEGISGTSFGLDVARLANVPKDIIARASDLLTKMESQRALEKKLLKQKSLFEVIDYGSSDSRCNKDEICDLKGQVSSLKKKLNQYNFILQILYKTDLNNLSPKQAFDILWEIKNKKNSQSFY